MADDFLNEAGLSAIAQTISTNIYNRAANLQDEIDESNRRTIEIANQAFENRQKTQEAIEQTAANTSETNAQLMKTNEQLSTANSQLEKVVANQNDLIDTLRAQLEMQKGQLVMLQAQLESQSEQLKHQKDQLDILNNIFVSGKDGVQVEKEIMRLIEEQIDDNHPLREYVKDKGTDVAIAGIPVIYNALKMLLASNGIILP